MKKINFKVSMTALVLGGMMMFAACEKEKETRVNNDNPNSQNLNQSSSSFMTLPQAHNQLISLGFTLTPTPTWYIQQSTAHTVRYYKNLLGDEVFLHVYTDPIDVSNDDWSATCEREWIGTGPNAGSCTNDSDECRVEVIYDEEGDFKRWEIICCD